MRLMRMLATLGLGYGAYRMLRQRPEVMQRLREGVSEGDVEAAKAKVRDMTQRLREAVGTVGEAVRQGDMEAAKSTVRDMAQRVTDARGVQQAMQAVGLKSEGIGQGQQTDPVGQMTQVGLALVRAGQLAQERGTEQAVRDLGQQLITACQTIGKDLRGLGARLGITLSDKLDGEGQRLESVLSDLAGNLFDQAFADEVMNAEIMALDFLQDVIDRTDNDEIRTMATVVSGQLRKLEAATRQLVDVVHRGDEVLPGPGTSEGIYRDKPAA